MLAFENMSSKNTYGIYPEDLQKIFKQCPKARWACDLNHIYTNDKTMSTVQRWHELLGERLTHYHISSFGGFHDSFINTLGSGEEIILSGVLDLSKPLIHEGHAADGGMPHLAAERDFILKYLAQRKK